MTSISRFESIVRAAHTHTESAQDDVEKTHPFDLRNIHPDLPERARSLYDDGYYAEATFEAFKFLEGEIRRISGLTGTGFSLMMQALDEGKPKVRINNLLTESDVDEQKGFRHIFAGAQAGIRNPRGHETDIEDSPDECLDYLALASVLLRRLDASELR